MPLPSTSTLPVARRAAPRRRAYALLAAAVSAGLLAGCASAAPASEEEAPAASLETISFEYEGYSAEIPDDPKRVVVLDSRSGLEMALLADYPLVATAYGTDSPLSPLIDDDVAHLKNTAFDLNREEIASYDPDLIVVGVGWWNFYEGEDFKLGEIAPVLAVNDGLDVEGASADNPFEAMTAQLTLLGREDKAEEAIAGYEKAVADARERIGAYTDGKVASVIHSPVDNFTVISDESIYEVVLPELGFTILDSDEINAAPPNPNGIGHMLSYENAVGVFSDTDMLLVYKDNVAADLDPLLKRVPAVERGTWIEGNLAERFGFALTYTSFVNGIADAVEAFPDFSK
ncbi:ABC transporter substrate-binding protein [Leucobacter aridicollis]|uniref:ABC transporter substrate-binding protein n=1 Tax=Leucobacter aridicollis TaxID=283878 RepID=UPI002166DA9D|nr:ABC transporter substrate-binding protein [Leucobacter aridicollis]MCS3428210.1 iron complex transport system substrate-binding protein [Leucobacter aridicollis]